jgi:hypothetical protein
MAKEKSNFIKELLTNRRNLLLLLLLLGGSAVVITSALLIPGSPSGSSSSNGGGTSQSGTPVSSGVTPYEENVVPNWDFSKAALSADSSAFNLNLDTTWRTYLQGDYMYATGGKLIDGAPGNGDVFMRPSIRVINTKTGEMKFQYSFDFGSTYDNYLKTSTSLHSFNFNNRNMRIAYLEDRFVYVAASINVQAKLNESNSRLGGSYQPIIDALTTRYGEPTDDQELVYREYSTLIRFSLSTPTTFTVLGVSEASRIFSDIIIEDNVLYALHSSVEFESQIDDIVYSFITLPSIPSPFTRRSSVFLLKILINNLGDLTQDEGKVIGSTTPGGLFAYFNNYREGFQSRYFNDNGEIALGFTVFYGDATQVNKSSIATVTNQLQFSFISANEFDGFKQNLITASEERVDALATYANNPQQSITLAYSISGFYNFDTGQLNEVFMNAFNQYNDQAKAQTLLGFESDNRLYLTGNYDLVFNIKTISFAPSDQARPEYIYTLYKENKTTKVRTKVLEFLNSGIEVSGIFQKDNGFYLTGTIYENATNNTIKKSAALLRDYDDNFNLVDELILDGADEDFGGQIRLNNQAQPVWFVSSRSIDGPFSIFATSNPNQLTLTYTVTFR